MKRKKGLSSACKNKKGANGLAMVIIGIVLVVALGIFYSVIHAAQSEINDAIQLESDMSSQSKEVMSTQTSAMPNVFDAGVALFLVIIVLVAVGLSYNAPGNPIMLLAVILIIGALGFAGMIFSNTWESFSTDDSFSQYTDDFPLISLILNNYLAVVLVLTFLCGIAYVFGGSSQ